MQATLIYNGSAGGASGVSAGELQTWLHEAGFEPVYTETELEGDLDDVLASVTGLVVAAGGDGTVRAVAKRLVGKDVSLVVLPMGTANNVARTLGVDKPAKDIIAGLRSPRKCMFDLGVVRSPLGDDYFLEALGCGLFADLLYDYDPEEGKSVRRAFDTIREVLVGYEPRYWQLKVDGEELSDAYIGIEVLNTKATGPRLHLAPDADPGDGMFDVVCVTAPEQASLLDYLSGLGGLLTKSFDSWDSVLVRQGKKIEIIWTGAPFHVDDTLHPEPNSDTSTERVADTVEGCITVEVMAGALELWLPGD